MQKIKMAAGPFDANNSSPTPSLTVGVGNITVGPSQILTLTGAQADDLIGRGLATAVNTGAIVDTFAATMTLDVTYRDHVVAAVNGTSATVTYTPSGSGSAGDTCIVMTEADASGTVTATFASPFHSSGTQATTASHYSTISFKSDGTRWLEMNRTTAMS